MWCFPLSLTLSPRGEGKLNSISFKLAFVSFFAYNKTYHENRNLL